MSMEPQMTWFKSRGYTFEYPGYWRRALHDGHIVTVGYNQPADATQLTTFDAQLYADAKAEADGVSGVAYRSDLSWDALRGWLHTVGAD